MRIGRSTTLGLALAATVGGGALASDNAANNLSSFFDHRDIPITVDNFVRAATEIEFAKYLSLSGGVNKLFHVHEPTAIDQQPTIRMNRDTLYSMAIIDVSQGAVLTMPETGISRRISSTRITIRTRCFWAGAPTSWILRPLTRPMWS